MIFTSPEVAAVFERYEQRDAEDRIRMAELGPAGMSHRDEFLLPVGKDVGAFLRSLIIAHNAQIVLEIGTSYGYSTLFLADAVRQTGGRLTTLEIADYKQAFARNMLTDAGLVDAVDFRLGDALELIAAEPGPFDLVLLDIWKELYVPCLDAFYPKLADEAVIAADNMIEPPMSRPEARSYRAAVAARDDLQSVLLPIGSGIELSCKWVAKSDKL